MFCPIATCPCLVRAPILLVSILPLPLLAQPLGLPAYPLPPFFSVCSLSATWRRAGTGVAETGLGARVNGKGVRTPFTRKREAERMVGVAKRRARVARSPGGEGGTMRGHRRGAPPPAPVCVQMAERGPAREWGWARPSSLAHNSDANGAGANPEAVPPPLLRPPHLAEVATRPAAARQPGSGAFPPSPPSLGAGRHANGRRAGMGRGASFTLCPWLRLRAKVAHEPRGARKPGSGAPSPLVRAQGRHMNAWE